MTYRVCIFEDDQYRRFYPLTHLRPVAGLRAGILPQFRRIERYLQGCQFCLSVRNDLAGTAAVEYRDLPINIVQKDDGQALLFLNGRIRDFGNLPELIKETRVSTRYVSGEETAAVFFEAKSLGGLPKVATPDTYSKLLEDRPDEVAVHDTTATLYQGCWEFVEDIDREIAADFAFLETGSKKSGDVKVHERACLENPDDIYLGSGVKVAPLALIDASDGPVYIGDNSRVEPQAAVYGPCYIGPNSVVVAGKIAGCSIGHTCRVGGEVEESIFQSYVNKYHAGFIGHAYVGSWVNFGAMTTNSDLKNNYSTIRVTINGEVIDTGSIKVGSLIGDHTKFGIGTLLNTGINIGVCCNLFGGSLIADKEVPSFRWGNTEHYDDYRFDKALETARKAAGRRNVKLSAAEEELLQSISEGRQRDEGVLRFDP